MSGWVIQICLFLCDSSLLRYDVTLIGAQLLCFKGACCLHVQSLRSPRKETDAWKNLVYCFKKWTRTHSAKATRSVSWWRQRTQQERSVSLWTCSTKSLHMCLTNQLIISDYEWAFNKYGHHRNLLPKKDGKKWLF